MVFIQDSEGCKFQCGQCCKVYKHKGNLVKHQRYECGNKMPFSCLICDYRANQKGNLLVHLLKHHKRHPLVKDIKKPKKRRNKQVGNPNKKSHKIRLKRNLLKNLANKNWSFQSTLCLLCSRILYLRQCKRISKF